VNGASAPLTLAESVGAAVNGKLYVLGGFHGQTSPEHYIAVPNGYVYNPATNKWIGVAPMPEVHSLAGRRRRQCYLVRRCVRR
jgi:N-acetylneuraminic acid mutarotase